MNLRTRIPSPRPQPGRAAAHPSTRRGLAVVPALLLPALVLAACAQTPVEPDQDTAEASVAQESEETASAAEESATAQPRVALTYDGGLLVLDALTLEVVADLELEGFNRISAAGDDRHVLVAHTATDAGWHVLDTGAWSEAHGDHAHHYVGEPHLTGTVIPAETPAHVVPHGDRTVLFDDGTGDITVIDPAALTGHAHGEHADEGEDEHADEAADHDEAGHDEATLVVEELTSLDVHHGVAVLLSDGRLVSTLGTEEARTGVRLLDRNRDEVARNESCPGVHGEAVTSDETVVVGCEDGVLLVRGTEITKVAAPAAFGRIGNQYVSDASPIAVGDYKSDPEQGLALDQLSLIDTVAATMQVVPLPDGVSYTWRGVGRGPSGEALVLGTDGNLWVIDPVTGTPTVSYPVIDAWTEPEEWQLPHPAMTVLGETAYVTDPATQSIHAVDLVTGEVWASGSLPATPNEIVAVNG